MHVLWVRRKKILDAREPFRDPRPLIEQRGGFVERREIDLDDLRAALPRQRDAALEHRGSVGIAAELKLGGARHAAAQRRCRRWSDGCGWRE